MEAMHFDNIEAMRRPVCAASMDEIAFSIDYGDLIPINDQLTLNSCSGNATDTAVTADSYIQTGVISNTSARACYLLALLEDGYANGRAPDQGASIAGAVLATQRRGCVLESDFPYWREDEAFSSFVPEEILAKALDKRVRATCQIDSYESWLLFTGTLQGTTVFGINWTAPLRAYRGSGPVINYAGPVVGAHALCAFEYVDRNGEKWPIVRNSHSRNWGSRGRMIVAPDIFDKWMKSRYGAMGITGSPGFAKRKLEMIQGAWS